MKNLIVLLVLVSTGAFAQIRFENGYFIDNSNNRKECLIRNKGWNNNPVSFQYRDTEESPVTELTIDNVKEFGVGKFVKYVRANVDVDRSSEMLQARTRFKEPVFTNEKLFLKVLYQGRNALYEYVDSGLQRYFYLNNDKILPLIHKVYTSVAAPGDGQVYPEETRHNNTYLVQLWKDVKCPDTKMKRVEKVEYNQRSLMKYFQEVNSCNP